MLSPFHVTKGCICSEMCSRYDENSMWSHSNTKCQTRILELKQSTILFAVTFKFEAVLQFT